MPSVSTVSPTGDPYVDGVISGVKWGVNSLTFSFPSNSSYYGSRYGNNEPSNGFKAFNDTQKTAVRAALQLYSSIANLSFSEVSESSTKHGDLRYAESNAPSTAWSYYPSTSAVGGDSWYNNGRHYYDNPLKGNYAWVTMIHETGHALGLKHPHEASGAFGILPADHDSLEYSVMSYRSYVGASTTTGYTNQNDSFPQTLMMYDIAAIQKLYGANYSVNSGNTVYSWDPKTGQEFINGAGQGAPVGNKIFMTLWDGGGTDTYDFSNYTTSLTVDLQPGGWTTASAAQLAQLGYGHTAVGNIANALLYQDNSASLIENAIGGSAADAITGNAADNTLTGNGGNDAIDGLGGTNTAAYGGASTDYLQVDNGNGTWTVTDLRQGSPDGTDTLTNIQLIQFKDGTFAIGTTTPSNPPVDPQPPVDPPVDPQPPVDPPTNIAPVASNDSYSVGRNSRLTVNGAGVLTNDHDTDGGSLSAILVSGPSKGSLSLNSHGSFIYTPPRNFSGTVTFTYKATDGTDVSNIATVTIKVGTTYGRASLGTAAEPSASNDQVPAFGQTDKGPFHTDPSGHVVLALITGGVHAADNDFPAPAAEHDAGIDVLGISDFLHGASDFHLFA